MPKPEWETYFAVVDDAVVDVEGYRVDGGYVVRGCVPEFLAAEKLSATRHQAERRLAEIRTKEKGEKTMIMENGLSIITVKKEELLKALETNREVHTREYADAIAGYHEAVLAELGKMYADAKEGKEYRKHVNLAEPENHTKDYDRVIRMLQMCVPETVQITEVDFTQYVLDEWNWKGRFLATSSSYKVRDSR